MTISASQPLNPEASSSKKDSKKSKPLMSNPYYTKPEYQSGVGFQPIVQYTSGEDAVTTNVVLVPETFDGNRPNYRAPPKERVALLFAIYLEAALYIASFVLAAAVLPPPEMPRLITAATLTFIFNYITAFASVLTTFKCQKLTRIPGLLLFGCFACNINRLLNPRSSVAKFYDGVSRFFIVQLLFVLVTAIFSQAFIGGVQQIPPGDFSAYGYSLRDDPQPTSPQTDEPIWKRRRTRRFIVGFLLACFFTNVAFVYEFI